MQIVEPREEKGEGREIFLTLEECQEFARFHPEAGRA